MKEKKLSPAKLYKLVANSDGVTRLQGAEIFDCSATLVMRALRLLEKAGRVYGQRSCEESAPFLWYATGAKIEVTDKLVKKIIGSSRNGLTAQHVAEYLGCSVWVARFHLKEMTKANVLSLSTKKGRLRGIYRVVPKYVRNRSQVLICSKWDSSLRLSA